MSSTPSSSPSPVRGVLGQLGWVAFAAGVLVLVWVLHHRAAALGWPYPYSDEAAHVSKTAELREALARAPTPWRRLGLWVFSGDAYPNAVYAAAIGQGATTLAGLRASTIAFLMTHVALALVFGRRLWGAAGTTTYVTLVALTAYPLAFSQGFYLDVPLVAAVGAGVLLLEASDGFRRVAPTILFVLVAATGLYTKWIWAVFCVVPCAVAALRALETLPGWRSRVAGAIGLLGLVGGGAWAVRAFGMTVPATGSVDNGPALALVIGAARVLAGWAALELLAAVLPWLPIRAPGWVTRAVERLRPFRPLANAGMALGLVGALVGPWYGLVWPRLWERYAHEQGAFVERPAPVLVDAERILMDLVPGGAVLVALGLILALVAREGRLAWATRVIGAGLAATLAIYWLPSDTRYLLPVLPLLAGAIVAGWRPVPWWGAVAGAVGCAAIAWVTAVGPLLGRGPFDGARIVGPPIHGVNVARREVAGLPAPVLVAAPPAVDTATMEGLVDAIVTACTGSPALPGAQPCLVRWAPMPGSPIVARGVVAMARLRGVEAQEARMGPQGASPESGNMVNGGLQCGLSAPGEAGWVENTWTSLTAANGCRAWVRRP
ncbi:MAG: hypothetical protein V4850_07980 [Myxococcota bacterium]